MTPAGLHWFPLVSADFRWFPVFFFFHSRRPPKCANVRQSAQKRAKVCQSAPKCTKVINALIWQAVCVIQSCHRQSVTFGQLLVQRAGGVLSQSAQSLGQALKSMYFWNTCAKVRQSTRKRAKARQSASKCRNVRQSAPGAGLASCLFNTKV